MLINTQSMENPQAMQPTNCEMVFSALGNILNQICSFQ